MTPGYVLVDRSPEGKLLGLFLLRPALFHLEVDQIFGFFGAPGLPPFSQRVHFGKPSLERLFNIDSAVSVHADISAIRHMSRMDVGVELPKRLSNGLAQLLIEIFSLVPTDLDCLCSRG